MPRSLTALVLAGVLIASCQLISGGDKLHVGSGSSAGGAGGGAGSGAGAVSSGIVGAGGGALPETCGWSPSPAGVTHYTDDPNSGETVQSLAAIVPLADNHYLAAGHSAAAGVAGNGAMLGLSPGVFLTRINELHEPVWAVNVPELDSVSSLAVSAAEDFVYVAGLSSTSGISGISGRGAIVKLGVSMSNPMLEWSLELSKTLNAADVEIKQLLLGDDYLFIAALSTGSTSTNTLFVDDGSSTDPTEVSNTIVSFGKGAFVAAISTTEPIDHHWLATVDNPIATTTALRPAEDDQLLWTGSYFGGETTFRLATDEKFDREANGHESFVMRLNSSLTPSPSSPPEWLLTTEGAGTEDRIADITAGPGGYYVAGRLSDDIGYVTVDGEDPVPWLDVPDESIDDGFVAFIGSDGVPVPEHAFVITDGRLRYERLAYDTTCNRLLVLGQIQGDGLSRWPQLGLQPPAREEQQALIATQLNSALQHRDSTLFAVHLRAPPQFAPPQLTLPQLALTPTGAVIGASSGDIGGMLSGTQLNVDVNEDDAVSFVLGQAFVP